MHMFAIAKRLVDGMWVSTQSKLLSHIVSIDYNTPRIGSIVEMSVDKMFVGRRRNCQQEGNKRIRMCEHCG